MQNPISLWHVTATMCICDRRKLAHTDNGDLAVGFIASDYATTGVQSTVQPIAIIHILASFTNLPFTNWYIFSKHLRNPCLSLPSHALQQLGAFWCQVIQELAAQNGKG